MSLTTTVTGTNSIINTTGTSIGIGPAVSTSTYWPPQEVEDSRRSHSFICEQVENGWVLTFNRKHYYVFENSSDMVAKMNALLVEKALAR